jgi:hypothetical protein
MAIRPVEFNSLGRDYVAVATVNAGTAELAQRLGHNFQLVVDDYDTSLQLGIAVDGYATTVLLIRFLTGGSENETRIFLPRTLRNPQTVMNLVGSVQWEIANASGAERAAWDQSARSHYGVMSMA